MTGKDTNSDLQHLERTLECFGANPERWPDEQRRSLKPFLSQSADARRMMDEARAVDRLLDMAPGLAVREGLAERIVEKATSDQGHLGAMVIRFRPKALSARAPWRTSWTWPSAALLAASLLLGLYVGATTGLVGPALTNGFDVAMTIDPIAGAFPEMSFEEDITFSEDFL